MKTIPMRGITAGFIGLLTTATIGITQEAQAGTVQGTSNVNFDNVTLTLNNNTIVPLFINTIQGGAGVNLDGSSDNDFFFNPNNSCGGTPISGTASATVPNGSANGGAAIDCLNGSIVTASNFANVFLTGNKGDGSAFGEYTIFTPDFDVVAGDFLDLEGLFSSSLTGSITGWQPGDNKAINTNYTATYTVFLDDIPVFSAPQISDGQSLVNINDSFNEVITNLDIGNIADYTFTGAGKARIEFFAREQVSANIERVAVPEPSTLIGLTAIGIGALASRKKKNNINN